MSEQQELELQQARDHDCTRSKLVTENHKSIMVWNHVNSEKFINETIGHKEYQILFGALPCLLQLALVLCLESRKGRRWDALHRTICMFFVGIGTTDVITNCVKYYVSEISLQTISCKFGSALCCKWQCELYVPSAMFCSH